MQIVKRHNTLYMIHNTKLSKRLRKAYFFSSVFQLVPYVRTIAISDTVTTNADKKDSDIDFFIIAKKNRIFTVRYGCVFWATILGQKVYPHAKKIKDRICLSFFIASDSLNLDYLNKNEKETKKRAFWITRLIPLFDENNEHLSFIIKNAWIKNFKKNYYFHSISKSDYLKNNPFFWCIKKTAELILFFGIGWVLEQLLQWIQIKRLNKYQIRHMERQRMIFNSKIIKLHYHSHKDKEIF